MVLSGSSTINTSRIDRLFQQTNFYTYYGDLTIQVTLID